MKNNLAMFWFCAALLFSFAVSAHALVITAVTDKHVYQLNDPINISITVSNRGMTAETLQGGGLYYNEDGSSAIKFTDYILNGSYVWSEHLAYGGSGLMWLLNFGPGQSRTWLMSHDALHMQNYPLTPGTHSIVGKAGFTLNSSPVTFQVVPEPATLLLLSLGGLNLRLKRRR